MKALLDVEMRNNQSRNQECDGVVNNEGGVCFLRDENKFPAAAM